MILIQLLVNVTDLIHMTLRCADTWDKNYMRTPLSRWAKPSMPRCLQSYFPQKFVSGNRSQIRIYTINRQRRSRVNPNWILGRVANFVDLIPHIRGSLPGILHITESGSAIPFVALNDDRERYPQVRNNPIIISLIRNVRELFDPKGTLYVSPR